ncbi:hypothetical protein FIA58_009930 [Flavobacterium jejuense]|uniref:Uncharacterized protein n=1 Tax=Flavobacterium jejuense TaxID=1544455 RepID=A0ABX0IT39_9FLAO|nr:hypothetical protein [Flavobacterium jejuense]NHN25992.1 hypothetical protein [Flavobacterium jejuense]
MENSFKTVSFIYKAISFFIFFLSISTFSQDKTDVIVMLDGEEKKGQVVAINENVISFIYSNETLKYEIKKNEISKIIFASGRTQEFSKQPSDVKANPISNASDRKGKMAVVPFLIITNMDSVDKDAFSRQIQSDCSNIIKQESPMIDVIDVRIVNATLAKNNITVNDLQNMLPTELAEVLGVEYVVLGSYEIENTGTRTTGSSVSTYKSKKDDNRRKGTEINSGSSTTTDTFNSKITIDIYNDKGSSIYSAARKPFAAGLDKYHSTISYLIKRAPFGSKR